MPTTKENVQHFDKEIEAKDFDSTPDLSDAASSEDERGREEGVRTVDPACLVRRKSSLVSICGSFASLCVFLRLF